MFPTTLARRSELFTRLCTPVTYVLLISCLPRHAMSQPATVPFNDCFTGNSTQKLNVTTVYAQVLNGNQPNSHLNLTILGVSNEPILGYSNDSTLAATLFTTATMLTSTIWTNSSYFCNTLRPPSPLPVISDNTYCPISPGPFGFSAAIPWSSDHDLTTVVTRLRAVDPVNNELLCLDVPTTSLMPGKVHSPYGDATIICWCTVALALTYWVVIGTARVVSALGRGAIRPTPGWWSKMERAGFVLVSAISGERLSSSRALLRFSTPSVRDIIFHAQWCAALAMVAVQWPSFAYPLLSQTSWAMLIFNVTLTSRSRRWDPLEVLPYNPPSAFASQLADHNSPLFLDPNVPNLLFTLPSNATSGISSFAYTVGIHPKDLFGVCLVLFLSIIAGTLAISFLVWIVDWIGSTYGETTGASKLAPERSPRASKDIMNGAGVTTEDGRPANSHAMFRSSPRFASGRKFWWKFRPKIGSFHWSVLHGNLVRILVLFHFPITIFSSYEMTGGRSFASPSSIAAASLSFIFFSLGIPSLLLVRVAMTNTNKLYDETGTLLCLGPLYNHFRHGSQLFTCLLFATNLAFGIIIGCGQKSGTAQAVLILTIEVVSALVTSIWLPWGQGASMGLISFLFCVARIVVAVLLVILTPAISVGAGPGGWIAYGILLALGLVFLAYALILFVKLLEAVIRIACRIGFDRSNHIADSGFFGVLSLLGCCRPNRRRRTRPRSSASPMDASSGYSVPIVANPNRSSQLGPPSVLRPEHALRPYKEESDDENGYIMGSWQPYPRPSFDAPQPGLAPSTGFTRISGGRAHIDAPYAIASRSTSTFPSTEEHHASTSAPNPPRHDSLDLPPGAMPPANIRMKPQTPVIEHPGHSLPAPLRADTFSTEDLHHPPTAAEAPPAATESDLPQPKKRPWFQLRKGKWNSEGDAAGDKDEEPASPSQAEPVRSFVVIRPKRVQQLSAPESSRSEATSSFPNSEPPKSTRP